MGFPRRLVFKVGDTELKNFRMIERHYFKEKLLRSYDFLFDFCMPNSTNSWESIYDLPKFSDDESMFCVGILERTLAVFH